MPGIKICIEKIANWFVSGVIVCLLSCSSPTNNDVAMMHVVPNDSMFSSNVTVDKIQGTWKIYLLKSTSNIAITTEILFFYYWGDHDDPNSFARFSEYIDFQIDSVNVYATISGSTTKLPDSLYKYSPFSYVNNVNTLVSDTSKMKMIAINQDTLRFTKTDGIHLGTDYYYYIKCDKNFKVTTCK
jgi:hypothetical protein